MNSFRLLITITFILSIQSVHAQSVQDVSSNVSNGKIEVNYTLTGRFYQTFSVSLFVSRDGGKSFTGPLTEVKGDVGKDIRRGNHSIQWDVMKEAPMVEESLVFDVRAEITNEKPKGSFFIQYVGNPMTYLGMRVGMLRIIGFYIEARANMDALNTATYTYKDGLVNYDKPGYFIFNENNGYSAYSALAGITYQPARNFYLYLGAGYGKEEYLLGMDTYDYEGDIKTGTTYAKYDGYSESGVEVDLGLMWRYKWFLISAGGTALNFKSFNFTAGVGAAF